MNDARTTIPRPRTDLVLAIPRAKSLRKLLPEVTALGIDRLVLFRSWRVAKPYLTQAILDPAQYRSLLHDGLMQAKCTREPVVDVEPFVKPFVEDRLPEFAAGAMKLRPKDRYWLHVFDALGLAVALRSHHLGSMIRLWTALAA